MKCEMQFEGCPGETVATMMIGQLNRKGGPAVPCCSHCYRMLTHDLERWRKPEKVVLVAQTTVKPRRPRQVPDDDPRLMKLL
jgi:Fe-S oxidoreductase